MSSYQDSENFKTCYVFKDVDDELATCLCSFWKDYHHEFWNNLQKSRGKEVNPNFNLDIPTIKTCQEHTAAVAKSSNGLVIGVIFILIRPLNPKLKLGQYGYFFNVFIPSQFRSFKLLRQLTLNFIDYFIMDKRNRDFRISALLCESIIPQMQNKYIRSFLIRKGFKLLSTNEPRGDTWIHPLDTTYSL